MSSNSFKPPALGIQSVTILPNYLHKPDNQMTPTTRHRTSRNQRVSKLSKQAIIQTKSKPTSSKSPSLAACPATERSKSSFKKNPSQRKLNVRLYTKEVKLLLDTLLPNSAHEISRLDNIVHDEPSEKSLRKAFLETMGLLHELATRTAELDERDCYTKRFCGMWRPGKWTSDQVSYCLDQKDFEQTSAGDSWIMDFGRRLGEPNMRLLFEVIWRGAARNTPKSKTRASYGTGMKSSLDGFISTRHDVNISIRTLRRRKRSRSGCSRCLMKSLTSLIKAYMNSHSLNITNMSEWRWRN